MSALEILNERLNGDGLLIIEEAKATGLGLKYAAGMTQKESGGRNVFGCDHGDTGDVPPYCLQPCTAPRVRALRAHHLANGVGPTQLTYDPFVGRADALGGAHIPRYNYRTGFGILQEYLGKYNYLEALGAYNRGEGAAATDKIGRKYANDLAEIIEGWGELLGGEDTGTDYPEINFEEDESQWLRVPGGGPYGRIRSRPNAILRTDKDGWIWIPKGGDDGADWDWPAGNAVPRPNSGWYVERCPTRYSWKLGGRSDIEAWARWLVNNFSCSVNTYHKHPEEVFLREGVSHEYNSYDVWGPGGRGSPLDPVLGDSLFSTIFWDKNPPNIRWIIYKRVMYGAWNGWQGEWFGVNPFSWHDDHIHVTYW